MITASDAVPAAPGLLGRRTDRQVPEPRAMPAAETIPTASAALLAPGERYFEAVAAALRRTGYLES